MGFIYLILGILVPFLIYFMYKARKHKNSYDYIHDKAVYETNKHMENNITYVDFDNGHSDKIEQTILVNDIINEEYE